MKTRPRRLVYLTALLLVMALMIPAQVMVMYGHSPLEWREILAKLAPMNWAILIFAPITATLIYQASPYVLLALPILVAIVGYNNYLVAQAQINYSALTATLSTCAFVLILGAFLGREVLLLFLHPEKRWWLRPVRHQVQVPIRVKFLPGSDFTEKELGFGNELEFNTSTFDLSQSGAFLPLETESGVEVGGQCFVSMPLKGLKYIQCRAEIVRATSSSGIYPAGLGIRFLGLSRDDQKELNDFLATQLSSSGSDAGRS